MQLVKDLLYDLKYFQNNNLPNLAQVEEQAIKSYLIAKLKQTLKSKMLTN